MLDTNTLLRGLVVNSSPSARVRRAAERRAVVVLLSKPVIDEYRQILTQREIVGKFPSITRELVEITIHRLRYLGEYVRAPAARFEYPRDPTDEKFIELAIELEATHILSFDRDLLSLPKGRGEAAGRFRQRLPNVDVMDAVRFVRENEAELGL